MRVKQIKENYEKIFDWALPCPIREFWERDQVAIFTQVKQISNN